MKLCIVDYIGSCDENKKPIGHSVKTINDFKNCLQESIEIDLIISKIYAEYISNDVKITQLNVFTCSSLNIFTKIMNILAKINVVRSILKNVRVNKVWFINTEFWFFFTLNFLNTRNRSIYVTNYINYLSEKGMKGFLKRYFYNRALNKICCVFTTNKACKLNKHTYLPDYFFDKEFYNQYISPKSNRIVCIGDMNFGKDIDQLIEVFNKNGIELLIAGKFTSNEIYEKFKLKAKSNIEIYNKFLNEEEYYKILGSSKYCILPYKSKNYVNRSSGVLLESAFLGIIVIAPNFLLNCNEINGIGYDYLCEINKKTIDIPNNIIQKILLSNEKKILKYEKKEIVNSLLDIFNFEN